MNFTVNTWQNFAKETILINDLDPTYQMIRGAKEDRGDEWAGLFCLHMLMFYHIGEAAEAAAVGPLRFYDHVVAKYDTCKRGSERRHFRGDNGRRAIASIIQAFPNSPQTLARSLYSAEYPTLRQNFQRLSGFGDYFIWKAADYLDRVFDLPIDFSEAYKYMPSEPAKCAKALWPELTLKQALDMVVDEIRQYPAPPSYNRPCGVAEAETVLCMLKGYFLTKSHVIGDDIMDKYKALGDDPYDLAQYLPPKVDTKHWVRGTL